MLIVRLFSPRFILLTMFSLASIVLLALLALDPRSPFALIGFAICLGFVITGVRDLLQTKHAILRNYPIAAHLRFLLEEIRPEIRQYFLESDNDGTPFSRDKRSIVYQRAKGQLDKRPVRHAARRLCHRLRMAQPFHRAATVNAEPFRISVGGPDCRKPYSASVFNISAMSFGALSANAIRALNKGARLGGFAHDTGEGGFSPYHRENGGDIIWEIGSGYFGCRNADGTFRRSASPQAAANDQVKMIEIKFCQGAKPGHGGVLPAAKVSPKSRRRAACRWVRTASRRRAIRAFSTPIEMMEFIAELRALSGGKPTGFKLCVGHPWEFLAICKAMQETGIYSRFHRRRRHGGRHRRRAAGIHRPYRHAAARRPDVRPQRAGRLWRARPHPLGASGKIITAFDMARAWRWAPTGATPRAASCSRWAASNRQSCHTDRCPTGVATQDPFASARWWWRTNPRAWPISIAPRCSPWRN